MPFHETKKSRSNRFSTEELIFFKQMSPLTDQPIRLAEKRPNRESAAKPSRPMNPTYLAALVGFAGILFFLSRAI
jgi:hypothetical protein